MEVVKLSKIGMGQAEQLCTLSLNMYSCLYSTVQLPGAMPDLSRGFIDTFGNIWDTQADRQTDSRFCRVASATKNQLMNLYYHNHLNHTLKFVIIVYYILS